VRSSEGSISPRSTFFDRGPRTWVPEPPSMPGLPYQLPSVAVIFWEQRALDQLDEDVHDLDVQLLHAIGEPAGRGTDIDVGQGTKRRSRPASQRDDAQLLGPRGFGRRQHVATVTACADTNQAIAGAAMRLDIAAEDLLVAVIVGNAAQMARVANRDCRQRP